jgi:hypothetical protein
MLAIEYLVCYPLAVMRASVYFGKSRPMQKLMATYWLKLV